MSIGAGIIVAIAFQQVDGTPNAEAGAEGDDESLQYIDRICEETHNFLFNPGQPAVFYTCPQDIPGFSPFMIFLEQVEICHGTVAVRMGNLAYLCGGREFR